MRINPVPFATSILCTHGWPKDLGFLFSLRISLRIPIPSPFQIPKRGHLYWWRDTLPAPEDKVGVPLSDRVVALPNLRH